jgi:hypothetical protein
MTSHSDPDRDHPLAALAASARPVSTLLRRLVRFARRLTFRSASYWERRYAGGGNSGPGSFGALAQYKAAFINDFVRDGSIHSVVEFGCGDGNQLALFDVPDYLGLDVSATAIKICEERFRSDPTKRFLLYTSARRHPELRRVAELSLSIDVLYHLVEPEVLNAYIDDLFESARAYVIVYSTDFEGPHDGVHQVDRKITEIIARRVPEFTLRKRVANPLKGDDSMSDFFVYERVAG